MAKSFSLVAHLLPGALLCAGTLLLAGPGQAQQSTDRIAIPITGGRVRFERIVNTGALGAFVVNPYITPYGTINNIFLPFNTEIRGGTGTAGGAVTMWGIRAEDVGTSNSLPLGDGRTIPSLTFGDGAFVQLAVQSTLQNVTAFDGCTDCSVTPSTALRSGNLNQDAFIDSTVLQGALYVPLSRVQGSITLQSNQALIPVTGGAFLIKKEAGNPITQINLLSALSPLGSLNLTLKAAAVDTSGVGTATSGPRPPAFSLNISTVTALVDGTMALNDGRTGTIQNATVRFIGALEYVSGNTSLSSYYTALPVSYEYKMNIDNFYGQTVIPVTVVGNTPSTSKGQKVALPNSVVTGTTTGLTIAGTTPTSISSVNIPRSTLAAPVFSLSNSSTVTPMSSSGAGPSGTSGTSLTEFSGPSQSLIEEDYLLPGQEAQGSPLRYSRIHPGLAGK